MGPVSMLIAWRSRVGLVVLWLVACAPAAGHAILLQSIPAANSSVNGPDIAISLQFNSRIDAQRSRLDLVLPDGNIRRLEIGRQSQADQLLSHASGLPAGLFHMRWHVLSTDGHLTRGKYSFRVR